MNQVKFLEVRGGLHGGMTFTPKVWAYKFSPTKRTPDRYKKWFARPTRGEVEVELNRRCRSGWADAGDL